jgi:plastocyanin
MKELFGLRRSVCQIIGIMVLLIATTTAQTPAPLTTNGDRTIIIRMNGSAYIPETSTIKIGQPVRFINDDAAGHTATALDGTFDSGYLGRGDSWQTTFSQTRTIHYSDMYHPRMQGTIVVTN